MKSALNGKADDLLQLKHRLDQAQHQADDILAPIKIDLPYLIDFMQMHNDIEAYLIKSTIFLTQHKGYH